MTWELKKVIMEMYGYKYKHVFVEDSSLSQGWRDIVYC